MENDKIENIIESDKKSFNNFTEGKTDKFDIYAFKRLVLSQLAYNRSFTKNKACGFTRNQIVQMVEYPERYGDYILKLCDFMYRKSGYFKRLIDYFVNGAVLNWTIDTEVTDVKFYGLNQNTMKKNYINFSAECNKFKLENAIHDILKRLYLNDACYAYVVEDELDISYFFLDPKVCTIDRLIDGNVYQYAIDRSLLNDKYIESLPVGLRTLIETSRDTQLDNRVLVPLQNSLCLKYNNDSPYCYPPFFSMIADILLIDDYKDISKTKAINDAYKLLVLKIPTKDGEITMEDSKVIPFVESANTIVQENIGVLPVPFDVDSVEFSGASSSDKDYVEEATDNMYKNVGVSQNLLSGSSSGSELKLSILNDNGDLFRIYRIIESWMSVQLKIRGFIYQQYNLTYKILDMTIYNQSDYVDMELKLAQASIPNKQKLMASTGVNPSKLLGNTHIENVLFKDIFDTFSPLMSAFQQSGTTDESADKGGRPELDEADKASSTVAGDKVDSNDKDNRM